MRKVLYSPGYGAGWVSWCSGSDELKKFMLEYPPIIEYLESGKDFKKIDFHKVKHLPDGQLKNTEFLPDCIQQFIKDSWEKFKQIPYLGGVQDLEVAEVEGAVQITDYDGYEEIKQSYEGWL
jgi:hypothetical protein